MAPSNYKAKKQECRLQTQIDKTQHSRLTAPAKTNISRISSEGQPSPEREQLPIKQTMRKRALIVSLLIILVVVIAVTSVTYLSKPKDNERIVQAQDFALTDLKGHAFRLSDFGGKVVVIDFMATWCPSCKSQLTILNAIAEKYGSRIVLLSIDVDPTEPEEDIAALAQQYSYPAWIWARDTANLAQAYQVSAIPKTIILDKDRYIRFEDVGLIGASNLIQRIEQLLG